MAGTDPRNSPVFLMVDVCLFHFSFELKHSRPTNNAKKTDNSPWWDYTEIRTAFRLTNMEFLGLIFLEIQVEHTH